MSAVGLVLAAACDCGDGGLQTVHPDIEVVPTVLTFGSVNVGTSQTRVIEVRNVGPVPLTVSEVRVTERTHRDLSVPAVGFVVDAGGTHELVVTFAPSATGEAFGAVVIASDDPDEPEVTVPIEATGDRRTGPALSLCVESADAALERACGTTLQVDFSEVVIGTTYRAEVTVLSVGTEPVDLSEAKMASDAHPSFVAQPSSTSGILQPDETRTVWVSFTPPEALDVTGVFEALSTDPVEPRATITFGGRGVESSLCLSDGVLDFGELEVGATADRSVTLENCGDSELIVSALEIESNPEFSLLTQAMLPLSLAVGETTTLDLRYAPLDLGDDRDRLRIVSNFPTSFVTLLGKTAACTLIALPPQIDFGAVATSRDRTFVLQNDGSLTCTIQDLDFDASTSAEFSFVTAPTVPFDVVAGGSFSIDLRYAPTDTGMDAGLLIVAPTTGAPINVPLSGRRLGPGECGLVVTPDPITFGNVTFGTTATQQVTLTNMGQSLCSIFQLRLGATSSLDFSLTPPMIPMIIRAGASRQIEVNYSPRQVGTATGDLEVFTGLVPITPDVIVPISGAGVGPRLCPNPNPVVFGTHQLNTTTTRNLNLYSCGTQDVVVSSISLPPPTTTETTVYMPPTTPLTIPAGQTHLLELRYRGVDEGRDDGILRLASNDALEPSQDVALIAHSSAGPCGDIQGRICDLTMTGPVQGATVYVNTPSGRVTTTTNASGDYVLTCVPVGAHTVIAEMGQWSTSFPATVNAFGTTVIPGQMCLDPSSAEVAVIYGEYDNMEGILTAMGVPHDFYMDAADVVSNPATLNSYDIVFINCGWDEFVGLSNTSRANLTAYVNNGGSLYASDWAYDIVEVLFPNAADFDGDDNTRDAAQGAGGFNGQVQVVDPTLAMALGGRTQIPISSCCTAITAGGVGTSTYLEGPRLGGMTNHPFMIGFAPSPSSGRVFYTDFHNTGQPDIEAVFRWLILQL